MKTSAIEARGGFAGWLRRGSVIAAAVVAAVLPLLVAVGSALADEYEPVTGNTARAATDPNPFVIAAYGFVWVALVIYVVGIARGLARAKAEIAELQRRVATASGGGKV